jgi:hypothetical protein
MFFCVNGKVRKSHSIVFFRHPRADGNPLFSEAWIPPQLRTSRAGFGYDALCRHQAGSIIPPPITISPS